MPGPTFGSSGDRKRQHRLRRPKHWDDHLQCWAVPRLDYDAIRDRYEADLNSALLFSGRDHDFYIRAKARVILDVVQRRLGDPSKLGALDVGCGIGLLDKHLVGSFADLAGADIAPQTLEAAAALNPGVRYELSDGAQLSFEDGEFDLAFAANVIHLLDPGGVVPFFTEMARVVRPGGLAIAIEHNPLNPLTRLVVRRSAIWSPVTEMISGRRLKQLARVAGLVVDEHRYLLVTPWESPWALTLERALASLPLGAQQCFVARRV